MRIDDWQAGVAERAAKASDLSVQSLLDQGLQPDPNFKQYGWDEVER